MPTSPAATPERPSQTQAEGLAVVDPEFVYAGDDHFRDALGTVGADGKRKWVYAKQPKTGRFYRIRTAVYWALIAVLVAMPFIELNGHPFMLFDVLNRRFIVFGQVFWPQDLYLFAIAMITTVVGIGLFTLAYGRLFCGWACPQTVFMEGVFRRLDSVFEGSPEQQRKLDAAPWTTEKLLRKGAKHLTYAAIAFVIGNVFLMYLIGRPAWMQLVTDDPRAHVGGLTVMLGFTALTWFNFAKFREQTCLVVCPYGRLQGVLLDANSIVVAYDWVRGEPRGKLKKNQAPEQRTTKDCIDCFECVRVCPTAIDIRNGTQLECVNCTACIDACDTVMDKVGQPRGLIRYASRNQIATGQSFRFTGRMLWLSSVLVVFGVVLTVLTFTRADVSTTILRLPGTSFQTLPDGRISNAYNLQLVNKTFDPKRIRFEVVSPAGMELELSGSQSGVMHVPGEAMVKGLVVLETRPERLSRFTTPVTIRVFDGDRAIAEERTSFLGPFTGAADLKR